MRVEHNGLYKWAISFFNGVGNFNFRSFFDAKELTFEIRPSDISPKENYPSYLSIVRFSFPRKIFTSDPKKSFYFSRKLQITSILLLLNSFYYLQGPVEYFREPLYANAGLVPTPFHRDTSRPATEAFFQAFPRLLHSIRRL